MAFIITTTGVPATVVIDDLGERTFVHPVVSYNLESEYSSFELAESADLQAAITGGELTAVDGSGNPITLIDQLTDLQSAYNSSMNPEIVTDATLGAVTVKRGSAADTDNVLETKNGAGSNTFEVTGAGKVTGTDFNDVALTTGGVATNYLDETGAYSAPTSGGVTSVTGTTPIASSGGATPAISISAATTIAAGSMSAADKTKLDGIAAGAQPGTITGIAVSLPLTTTGGTSPALNINPATVSLPGVMSAADKTKLDGISTGAVAYYKSYSVLVGVPFTVSASASFQVVTDSTNYLEWTAPSNGDYVVHAVLSFDAGGADIKPFAITLALDTGSGFGVIGNSTINDYAKKNEIQSAQLTYPIDGILTGDVIRVYCNNDNVDADILFGSLFIQKWY